jgi:acyl-CoA synthetase (AMP-forming)/AMP-acid ligase II
MAIYSGDPLEIEIPNVDLVSFTLARARALGDRPALIDGASGQTIGYAQLERDVRALAAGLTARGFRHGDTFAIYMPNVPEYATAFYGAIAAGGRCTTINPLYTARELAHQLADSGARMLLTAPAFLDAAREATDGTGCELSVLGEIQGPDGPDGSDATPFAELFGDPDAASQPEIDPAHDIAALPYSSGTTGLPKGVMLSHRNLIANMLQMAPVLRMSTDEEVMIAVLPLFHIYGLSVIMNYGLWSGATLVTMGRFELQAYLDLSERHRVTRAYVVPPIALALAHHPAVEGRDLSSLRAIVCGAAPLGIELEDACTERIGAPVIQAYGMTELSPGATVSPFGRPRRPGSVGPPLPGTECRLVDPASEQDVAGGERGELWVRGPQVMCGYLNNPAATAAMIDSDGWLRTGDVATVDEHGWFWIVDRVKELIKYKGFQVAPAELEAILITHPEVADCAVIGIPDEQAGELPKAFVVSAASGCDSDAVMEFVCTQVAPHKRIREIELVREIPKSPSGKILRRVLREHAPLS